MKTWVTRAGLLCLAFVLGACATAPVAPWEDEAPLGYRITYSRAPSPGLNVEIFPSRSFPKEFLFRQPGRVTAVFTTDADGNQLELTPRADGRVFPPSRTRVI